VETIYVVADTFNQLAAKFLFPLLGNQKAPNGGEHVFFVIDDIMYEWVTPGKIMMEKMQPGWKQEVTDIYSFSATREEKEAIVSHMDHFHFSDLRYVKLFDYLREFWKIPVGRAYADKWGHRAECVAVTREILRKHFGKEEMPILWSLKTAFLFEDFKNELTRVK